GIRDKLVTGVQTCALPIFFGVFFLRLRLLARLGRRQDDVVDQAIVLRGFRGEEVVALGVQGHLFDLLSGVPREDLVQLLARAQRSEERRVGKEWRSVGWPV